FTRRRSQNQTEPTTLVEVIATFLGTFLANWAMCASKEQGSCDEKAFISSCRAWYWRSARGGDRASRRDRSSQSVDQPTARPKCEYLCECQWGGEPRMC